ncbi:MAG: hypothetical protein COU31_04910 [Candidatus Magasanikbacteria bacterium CG10_big_fil_rev_8_21_14_0_10_40_10]|uniref:Uncharacterized protein n=1 Tax=Candidatus Magasanikbacteria bacterium CG10_big_fil_rev_8_21_14_0_10_40_10 TaxID=1974648 RepID=A0A2M6W2Q3_9BACT|nr:MAG: hypothetical protein COU31_04910 [Candidatus Magasanikbacteria bacterium CG10_big_fil_rev_8_21_14_0_10_40_10]
MDKAPAHLPPLVSKRENEVEEILNKLDFKVSSDNQNRLRAIIQLRLKEIRDDRQTEQTLQRSILEGGLGLLPSQAQKVIVAIKNVLPPNTIKPSGRPVSSTKQIMVEPPDLPQVYREPPVPARSTPFNSFVHSAKTPSSSAMTLEADKKQESKFSLRTPRQTKTVIHDIAPPQLEETQIGPVGEIQQFTLTDFRRLSANPAEAASRLRQKFTNLKDESYLLFIDGLSAWRESPLYNDYLAVLNKSLTQRIDLAQAAGVDNKTLTAPEIMALAEMEREL